MNLRNLFDDERDHWHKLATTGYFGARGAGCLFLAQDSKRLLLAHRSQEVEQPGTYGTWGGAIDQGEDPLAAVKREIHEETGFDGPSIIEPLLIFKDKTFRYYNFLVVVESEFSPILNWESAGYQWCDYGQWPTPLHFGLQKLLADSRSIATIKKFL
jgi:8-oxo-dGTP pyrophosphatase MutT (NUDIX family)